MLVLGDGLISVHSLGQAQLSGPPGHLSLVGTWGGPANSLDPVQVGLVVHLQGVPSVEEALE